MSLISSRQSAAPSAQRKGLGSAGLRLGPLLRTPILNNIGGSRQSSVVARSWLQQLLQPRIGEEQQTSIVGRSQAAASRSGRPDARVVVTQFYDAWNRGDLATIESLFAEDVQYHDLALYEEPFRGREEAMEFMRKAVESFADMKFVIDDITSGDNNKVGVMWHVEVGDGVNFPFSRGCSFLTINDQGQITQARDLVEPPSKPGDIGLVAMKNLAPLIKKLGPKADPANLRNLPVASAALWALYAGYISIVMLSSIAPGFPAYAQPIGVLQEILYESFNFFYVNIGLAQFGLNPVPNVPCPPVSEGIFNIVNAWGVMFLPIFLTEKKCQKINNKLVWFPAIMFLTNVFFMPFMALRAAPEPGPEPGSIKRRTPQPTAQAYPSWAKLGAGVGLFVGVFSLWWMVGARPEYGDLQARLDYFITTFNTNRAFWAFVLDLGLYWLWQVTLLGNVPGVTPAQRWVPFFGLAAHVLTAPSSSGQPVTDKAGKAQ